MLLRRLLDALEAIMDAVAGIGPDDDSAGPGPGGETLNTRLTPVIPGHGPSELIWSSGLDDLGELDGALDALNQVDAETDLLDNDMSLLTKHMFSVCYHPYVH